jgi:hypothetical protein
MEAKSGNLSLKFVPYSKASSIAVVVSWHCPQSNQEALNCLKHENACDGKGTAETALCYAMAQGIENALIGDPVTAGKTQVSSFRCNAIGSMFTISYCTRSSVTVLGRTIKLMLKVLKPSKYTSIATSAMRAVGQSLTSEGKNYVEASVVNDLKRGINIFVVGKMKTSSVDKKTGKTVDKLQAMLDKVSAAFPTLKEPTKKKVAPILAQLDACPKASSPKQLEFSVHGIDMVYLFHYLFYKLHQEPDVKNNKLAINKVSQSKIDSLKDKNKVKAYVTSKYGKLGNEVVAGTCFFAAAVGIIGGISLASIETALVKALS